MYGFPFLAEILAAAPICCTFNPSENDVRAESTLPVRNIVRNASNSAL
jgi:hypothetical protein